MTRRLLFLAFLLALLVAQPLAVFACATCGCSELCPISMIEDEENGTHKASLSDSLWGSIILRMAYLHDPLIQKQLQKQRFAGAGTFLGIGGAVGGTFAQNIVSLATLNPPPPQSDSYLPGSIGLGMSGLVNIAFDGSTLLNWRINSKIRKRQADIRTETESILQHLEFSQADCPEAQQQLTELVGARAASDCLKLWHSSHTQIAKVDGKTISDGAVKPEAISLNPLDLASVTEKPVSYVTFVP